MSKSLMGLNLLLLAMLLAGCGGQNSPSQGSIPGSEERTKTNVLEAGSALLQDTTPVDQLEIYLNGFHYAEGNLNDQMEAHHYCEQVNEDIHQCALYDGNGKDAILIGVEHIVSDKLFKTLLPDEQKMWHPHYYEVGSGQLIAPGLPQVAEHELMEEIYTTHGKTWHIWDTRKQKVPMGKPMLMMGFTRDGQLRPEFVQDRDKRFKVNTAENRRNRRDIPWATLSGHLH